MKIEELQKHLIQEAEKQVKEDSFSETLLMEQILSRRTFAEMLGVTLACNLAGEVMDRVQLEKLFLEMYAAHQDLLEDACKDLHATVLRDPACSTYLEPLLFFKGFQGLQTYRVAHVLWKTKRLFAAKLFQSVVSRKFGMDIHPAAQIGHGILVDHATNIVVGETAVIGNNVSIFHGVTLGGTGNECGDRHPKVESYVMLGAHAQLLGNIRIGEGAKIGAGSVVLQDVPSHTTFAGVPAVEVGRPADATPSFSIQQNFMRDAER